MDFVAHPSRFSSSSSSCSSFGNFVGSIFSAIFTFFFAVGSFSFLSLVFWCLFFSFLCLPSAVCSLSSSMEIFFVFAWLIGYCWLPDLFLLISGFCYEIGFAFKSCTSLLTNDKFALFYPITIELEFKGWNFIFLKDTNRVGCVEMITDVPLFCWVQIVNVYCMVATKGVCDFCPLSTLILGIRDWKLQSTWKKCSFWWRLLLMKWVCLSVVGTLLGAMTGALIGQETESGFVRGAAVGAISGAVFSIEVFESSLVLWQSDESGIGCLLYLVSNWLNFVPRCLGVSCKTSIKQVHVFPINHADWCNCKPFER